MSAALDCQLAMIEVFRLPRAEEATLFHADAVKTTTDHL